MKFLCSEILGSLSVYFRSPMKRSPKFPLKPFKKHAETKKEKNTKEHKIGYILTHWQHQGDT